MQQQTEIDAIARIVPDMRAIRRDLHQHPELAYEEHRTAGIVAKELRRIGIEVTEGIGGTGVVGTCAGATRPAR